ncbi:MAG TPA: hypothetical protein VMC79_01555, partial [Rectinemataceae bacterium]|nr:hypothetical protein [Rectinemataceae bacterium]
MRTSRSLRGRIRSLVFCLSATALFTSCTISCRGVGPERCRSLTILSYNVLSLFDPVDEGSEYPEFSVASGSWNESLYRTRLENLARVVLDCSAGHDTARGPDLLCLVEIENR